MPSQPDHTRPAENPISQRAAKAELKAKIIAHLDDLNRDPTIHTWTYKINDAA